MQERSLLLEPGAAGCLVVAAHIGHGWPADAALEQPGPLVEALAEDIGGKMNWRKTSLGIWGVEGR